MPAGLQRPLLIIAILFGPLVIAEWYAVKNGRPIALFVTIVILWLTELLPLAVTGMLVPVLLVVFGILSSGEAFSPFGNAILFLFIGCFFLAHAMQKHGWDKRMAFWILSSRLGGNSPATLIPLIGAICFVLSMWVSNTATAAMMTPICLGIINTLENQLGDAKQRRLFEHRILLTMAFASTIGGLATPVGSPPNLIAIQFLAEAGITISFLEWMCVGLPIALLMFLVLNVIMRFRFPIAPVDLRKVREYFHGELKELGPLKNAELQVAGVFSLTVFLWVFPSLVKLIAPDSGLTDWLSERLPMNVVGIGAALLLFVLRIGDQPNLTWKDAQKIDWGTILLFGGGLAMGKMLSETGLAAMLGNLVFDPSWGLLGLIAGAALFGIIMSEFSSNTASASIVIPIVLSVLSLEGFENASIVVVVMACAFGATYGFMLPVSTPPNAIAFGTGKLSVRNMVKTGILFDLSGAILIIAAGLLLSRLGIFP